jgi:hypothetical protein
MRAMGGASNPHQEDTPSVPNRSADLIKSAIADIMSHEMKKDPNQMVGGGKWLFGPQLLGE